MIKLQASYGLKVPAAEEFSSQSFHASIELELADSSEQVHIQSVLKRVWSDLKQAVEAEIASSRSTPSQPSVTAQTPPPSNGNRLAGGNGYHPGRSHASGSNGNGHPTPATKKQLGFLLGCARRNRNWSAEDTKQWLKTEYGCDLNALTKAQAAQAIDALQAQAA